MFHVFPCFGDSVSVSLSNQTASISSSGTPQIVVLTTLYYMILYHARLVVMLYCRIIAVLCYTTLYYITLYIAYDVLYHDVASYIILYCSALPALVPRVRCVRTGSPQFNIYSCRCTYLVIQGVYFLDPRV